MAGVNRPVRLTLLTAHAVFLLCACHRAAVWTARTPDHQSSLVVQARDGRHCVRLDARDDGCFDGVDVHSITFDRTGSHAAIAVRVGTRWTVAVDGRPGAPWDGVGAPRLSADGAHVAYPAYSGGRWRVAHDANVGPPFDAIVAGSLLIDDAGCGVVYVARRGAEHVVVSGADVSAPWQSVRALALDTAQQTSCVRRPRTAFAARDSAGWHLVYDGMVGTAYDDIRDVRFATSSEVLAIARRGHRESLLRSGRPVAWHDAILRIAVGHDGRVGYLAQEGSDAVAIMEDRAELARGAVADLALGAAGHVAWILNTGPRQSIVSTTGTYQFDRVVEGSLQFVGSGRSWAALVGDRVRRELRVVIDGRDTGRTFDWSEIARMVRQTGGAESIRAWVASEALRHD